MISERNYSHDDGDGLMLVKFDQPKRDVTKTPPIFGGAIEPS